MNARLTVSLDDLTRLKADARGFSLLPRQPVTSLLAGRHASRLRGRGLAFKELREYYPGDDVRTIDWKATARLRKTQVRVYDEERERPVLFVVDQRSPMFFGSRRATKSVTAAEVAALGAWRVLDAGDRVGGLVFNETEVVDIRPHRSQTRVVQFLSEIVRLNEHLAISESDRPESRPNEVTLNQVLAMVDRYARHDFLIVLISDLDGADDETRRLATRLAAHNDVLVVGVFDPLGASLVGQPGMMARGDNAAWEIPAGRKFTDAFQQAFQRRIEQWTAICRALRVPVLPISTARPVIDQIHVLFGNRPVSS